MLENFVSIKKPTFGLDIGYQTIKIAYLDRVGKKGYRLISWAQSPCPPASLQKNGIKEKKKLADSLVKTLREAKPRPIRAKCVSSALPESFVFTKTINLPLLKPKDLEKTIPYEASDFLPVPIEEVYLDWHVTQTTKEGYEVLVIAAPKRLIDDYIEFLRLAGLELVSLETKPIAAARAILSSNLQETIAVLDIGSISTGVAIFEKTQLKLTGTISTGAQQVVEKVEMEHESLKKEIEEKIQKVESSTPSVNSIEKLAPVAEEINHLIKYYQARLGQKEKVSQIYLTGGGANLSGICAYFSRQTGIKTMLGNPLEKLLPGADKIINPAQARILSVAIGANLGEGK
jgi:type IV pilus assembly protein PilM